MNGQMDDYSYDPTTSLRQLDARLKKIEERIELIEQALVRGKASSVKAPFSEGAEHGKQSPSTHGTD